MPCGWGGNPTVGRRTGHASQTSVVYPPAGSRPERKMPTLLMGHSTLYLTLPCEFRCAQGNLGVPKEPCIIWVGARISEGRGKMWAPPAMRLSS